MESRAPECDQSEVTDALLRIKIPKIRGHDESVLVSAESLVKPRNEVGGLTSGVVPQKF